MKIELKILEHGKEFYRLRIEKEENGDLFYDSSLPVYATSGSAAVDLRCIEDVTIYPGETVIIKTGLAMWIGSHISQLYMRRYHNDNFSDSPRIREDDWCGQPFNLAGLIIPRSGLGAQGLVLANTVGLIDEDYQGELLIKAWNRNTIYIDGWDYSTSDPIELKAGDRVAQMLFIPVIKAEWQIVDEFSKKTERGEGGFGSTGQ